MARLVLLPALLALAAAASVAAPARDPSLEALRGAVIAIDPGHNGGNWAHPGTIARLVDAGTLRKPCDTTGAETAAGYAEHAFAFDVALRLRALLRAAGARVVLTRRSDSGVGPCITERAAIGNRAGADAAISIHADGGPPAGRGFHVVYPELVPGLTDDIAGESHRLALAVRAAYRVATGLPPSTYAGSRGLAARSDLGGLNRSDVPKVLIETGNLRNPTDATLLGRPVFRQRVASGLARGLARFLAARD